MLVRDTLKLRREKVSPLVKFAPATPPRVGGLLRASRANRAACIAIYGLVCAACGMRMSDRYGEAARDLVEVHHLNPLACMEAPTPVDPRTDLIPLCPNCHRVAHLASPPYSPEQIRALIQSRDGLLGNC